MTRQQTIKIAGHVGCDPRTVARWAANPSAGLPAMARHFEAACKKLGIANPHLAPVPPIDGA
jgi:hypothetical protein